ncbi:MAG: hypothetical protein ACTS2F_07400 [Thainema sp.]
MKSKHNLQADLIFRTSRNQRLKTSLIQISLEHDEDSANPATCKIVVNVSYASYQTIKQEALFNLLADQILINSNADLDQQDVEVHLLLKPSLTNTLFQQCSAPELIADYLIQISWDAEDNFWLFTENWLASEFKQLEDLPSELDGMGELKFGYQTFWANPKQFSSLFELSQPSSIKTKISGYLQSSNSKFEEVNPEILRLKYQGKNGNWICLIKIDESKSECAIYSVFPEPIPQAWRQACAVSISQFNYDLSIGNFEIDLEDGDLRCRTAINLAGENLSSAIFRQLLLENVDVMDRYLPDLKQFLGFS